MGLHDLGLMGPHELAPLAYEARMAAKKYARERCVVPARLGSMLYDGWRQWRKYGKFDVEGMSWDQIWEKYEAQVVKELDWDDIEEAEEIADEVTARVCMRILERSCTTNKDVDSMFLKDGKSASRSKEDIRKLAEQLDQDIMELVQAESGYSQGGRNEAQVSTDSLAAPSLLSSLPSQSDEGVPKRGLGYGRLSPREVLALRFMISMRKKIATLVKDQPFDEILFKQALSNNMVPSEGKQERSNFTKKLHTKRKKKMEITPPQRSCFAENALAKVEPAVMGPLMRRERKTNNRKKIWQLRGGDSSTQHQQRNNVNAP